MKKKYITPLTTVTAIVTESVIATSTLTAGLDNQSITPTNDEYDGEFSSKGRDDDWSFDSDYDW